MDTLEIKDLQEIYKVNITCKSEWVNEMLEEVNSLLDFDVDNDFPSDLRQRLLQFLQTPAQLFSFDSKGSATGGTTECRILLKPTDGFLEFILALRAWNRELNTVV